MYGELAVIDDIKHWCLHRDADEIAWLGIDRATESANSLSAEVLQELETIVAMLSTEQQPRALVIYSAKSSGFIVGADVREFAGFNDPEDIAQQAQAVHQLFKRLETAAYPVVARIHGLCLGGGLELALACRYRIAEDSSTTRFGFPEVLLGIHPGFAGSVRSIERIGVTAAMDLMLTGRQIDARRALKLGLVDRAVPRRLLDKTVREFALRPHARKPLSWPAQIANRKYARPAVAKVLQREVAKKARLQHYPAPYALIDLWREHGGDREAMMAAEARSIGRLLVTPTSRNLQRLFLLQERLKRLGKGHDFTLDHLHVIGAGTMGGDIAAWCAAQGLNVTLQDREARFIAPAIARAERYYKRRIKDRYERQATRDRLIPDLEGAGIRTADVIIEAIVEDLAAKQALFRDVEARARPQALLATNTSSIPLEDIANALEAPERLVGIHFFNPVAKMQLVEIIGGSMTEQGCLGAASRFTVAINRLPLPARSAPGFLINRILSPYMQEAMMLVDEGVSPVVVDKAAVEFGMPMGPIELADTVGLDICLSVGEVLTEKLGGEEKPPACLVEKVAQRRLGRKTKVGFYEYDNERVIRGKYDGKIIPEVELRDRLILRLVNEAVACLREDVVEDPDLVDVGMVFGAGFAPFRGGPIQYARDRGIEQIQARLKELARHYGDRFEADAGWVTLAAADAGGS